MKMALSLGVSIGSKVQIGDKLLVITDILNGNHISLTYGGKTFLITESERTEIDPTVFVSCGSRDSNRHEKYTRLAFEAPREIQITRLGSE
jgi:hypothetical protein